MKKLLIATAVAATLFAPQAFAQAKKFEGFSVAGNLVVTNSTFDTNSTGLVGSATATSTNLALQGQYAWALNEKFVLGVGAQLGLGDVKSGTISGSTIDIKGKNWNSIYVAPGYVVSDTLLVYGKLAALTGDLEASAGAANAKSSGDGIGFGIGVQSFLTKNVFIQGELMSNTYSEKKFTLNNEVDKYKNTQFSVGVGYKF
jgi:outer membrane immunogenic protein